LRGDGGASIELYTALIEHEPESPKLWNELGVAHHQTGALDDAEVAYRRALEIDPDYPLAWNNLGVVLHHRVQPEAEGAFRSALKEGRALGDAWRNFALLLHREGRREESLRAYRAATEADPSSAQACTGCGILLL